MADNKYFEKVSNKYNENIEKMMASMEEETKHIMETLEMFKNGVLKNDITGALESRLSNIRNMAMKIDLAKAKLEGMEEMID